MVSSSASMMSCSRSCVSVADFHVGEPLGDLLHVVAHQAHGFREGHRGAFFAQQHQRPVGFADDQRFFAAEAGGFDFVVVVALGLRALCRAASCRRRSSFGLRAFCGSGRRAS